MDLQRPLKSAAEIAALPELSAPEFDDHLEKHGPGFDPETLVYILRKLQDSKDTTRFRRCGEFLVGIHQQNGSIEGGHCEGIIRNLAKAFRLLEPEILRDYRADCYALLWREISARRPKSGIWEERFGLAFRARAIDAARSLHRKRNREKMLLPLVEEGEEAVEGLEEEGALDDMVSSTINRELLLLVLQQLPPKQAMAAHLVWVEGWLIESEDREETTAATVMGITGRMVRKHLRSARERLRVDPLLRAILEDDGRI